ncbi:hypothetical protein [Arsenophonus endosymbiont of Bemisia tabaci]|nr:hypothetical protein [Arsenophonus endosymbiont of Bemisia tabaci]
MEKNIYFVIKIKSLSYIIIIHRDIIHATHYEPARDGSIDFHGYHFF